MSIIYICFQWFIFTSIDVQYFNVVHLIYLIYNFVNCRINMTIPYSYFFSILTLTRRRIFIVILQDGRHFFLAMKRQRLCVWLFCARCRTNGCRLSLFSFSHYLFYIFFKVRTCFRILLESNFISERLDFFFPNHSDVAGIR